MKEFFRKLKETYTTIYENKKAVRILCIIISILFSLYYLIDAMTNYKFSWFIQKEIVFGLYLLGVILLFKIFHKLFGKWFVHETKLLLTEEYIKIKLPRCVKFDGYRGVGKDSTVNAIRKIFRDDLIDKILDEMDLIRVVTYPYDIKALDEYLDKNHNVFMTSSKNKFFLAFIIMMKTNNCFIKEIYSKSFNLDEHIQELYDMKKNPNDVDLEHVKYKYDNGITKRHYLALLIKYSMLYIRIHFINSFIMSNQPTMETVNKGSKIFSTRFTNIRKENSQWPWPIDGNVIIVETEVDGLYPNVGKMESAMTTGLRDFKAFFRHFEGESSVWLTVGQNASRTEKTLRELDFAFIKVIEQSKVYGGEKRIFFVNIWLRWIEFWIYKSIRNKSREKQFRRKSKAYELNEKLKNEGYIYVDIKVSRSELQLLATEMTIKRILAYDKPIFENYMVKLCFRIKDAYVGYNSHYLEAIGEMKANKSNIHFQDVPEWDPDLILKHKQIHFMEYPVLDKTIGIDRLQEEKERKKQEAKQKREKKKEESDPIEGNQEENEE